LRALRLTEDERDHLYVLAGHRPPAGRRDSTHVRAGQPARGRRPPGYDADSAHLVARLRTTSTEFAALWELHEVAQPRHSRMRVVHPEIGPILLDLEYLLTPSEDQWLVVFTPPPGTGPGPARAAAGGRFRTVQPGPVTVAPCSRASTA
jgi:hypothetical protein